MSQFDSDGASAEGSTRMALLRCAAKESPITEGSAGGLRTMRETWSGISAATTTPFTGNIRNCSLGGDDLDLEKEGGSYFLNLLQGQIIMVVDGQHRRFGYSLVTDWLNDILMAGRYVSVRKGGLYLPEGREETPELSQDELAVWGSVYEEAKAHCTVDVTLHLGLRSGS